MPIINLSRSNQVAALCWTAFAVTPAFAQTAADLPPPHGCNSIVQEKAAKPAGKALQPAFPPIQLEIRTPIEPTVLPAGGRNYLIYELHLRNFADEPMAVRGVEVINADNGGKQPVIALDEKQLEERLRWVGVDSDDAQRQLGAGQTAIAFLCFAFDANTPVPNRLRHRVLLDKGAADGPVIDTRFTKLHVLGPPLAGANWTADNGPSIHSHHRTGVFVAGGLAQISRRYAFDWKKYQGGLSYSGDARDVNSYYAYGENVIAVADGRVIAARDGLPDNIPRTKDGFSPALPITMENIAGNNITIDLGDGQFAQYAHLQPGSVRVKAGDRVRRGQLMARVGSSGDAREPHLHFQVATTPYMLASEGLPYLLDQFRVKVAVGRWETRTREFPLDSTVIDFGILDMDTATKSARIQHGAPEPTAGRTNYRPPWPTGVPR